MFIWYSISGRITLSLTISQNKPNFEVEAYTSSDKRCGQKEMQTNQLTRQPRDEIKLFEDSKERNRLEELSDLYAIIKATELLEAAYSRDCITAAEYSDACSRTISQFKTTESALISRKSILSTEAFMKEFQIDCPRAYERLVVAGL